MSSIACVNNARVPQRIMTARKHYFEYLASDAVECSETQIRIESTQAGNSCSMITDSAQPSTSKLLRAEFLAYGAFQMQKSCTPLGTSNSSIKNDSIDAGRPKALDTHVTSTPDLDPLPQTTPLCNARKSRQEGKFERWWWSQYTF
jgi:hypothetical protein